MQIVIINHMTEQGRNTLPVNMGFYTMRNLHDTIFQGYTLTHNTLFFRCYSEDVFDVWKNAMCYLRHEGVRQINYTGKTLCDLLK